MLNKRVDNWEHYYKVASERPDLRMFKDLLRVNSNQTQVDLGLWKVVTKDGEKTFNDLIEELKPNT